MEKLLQITTSVMLILISVALSMSISGIEELREELKPYKLLIEECEKSLPRDKTCKLVAVEEKL